MTKLNIANKIGKLGEDIAVKKLLANNFRLVDRNWLEKTGEIDIIAEKDNIIHFVEVKSVSCENLNTIYDLKFRPEENMHSAKIARLHKTIELYMTKKSIHHNAVWQLDLYCVYIDIKNKHAKINKFLNIV